MDWDRKSIRVGAAVIVCAVALRLFAVGLTGDLPRRAISVLWFLETGRLPGTHLTLSTEPAQTLPSASEPPPETVPPEEKLQAVFSAEDATLVQINNACGYETDVAKGLTRTLSWDLIASAPTVLIVHSHGSESYENTENYKPSGDYRTQDVRYNVVSVGDRLVQILEAGGVRTVHDRTLHDVPSYSNSYESSRQSVAGYLEQYPGICLVLDIHRDAVADTSGKQMKFTVDNGGEAVAQLMLVVGTDASGLSHPLWPENMSLAVKLHAQLEKLLPGLCRPISFRSQRFNQDLSPGALIVEVGSAGNTRQEALAAVELLGEAILTMAGGTTAE